MASRPTTRRCRPWRAIPMSRASRYDCWRSRRCSPKAISARREYNEKKHLPRLRAEETMSVQLICCSHSPLMTTDVEESEQDVHAGFFQELESASAALHKFNPDLVVVFGPDHFNGFFYELMPAFCIGTAAQATKDWHLKGGALKVPRDLAIDCVRHLQTNDFDVALSHAMKVDHGITIPFLNRPGALARYDVRRVFINCAADPRPSFRRARAFGSSIGELLAKQDMKITVVGSGGLSHDPPTPRID